MNKKNSSGWEALQRPVYPFTAIVGQDQLLLALVLNAIDPSLSGVLVRGQKGTAKSTAARAVNGNMLSEYTARNQQALETLVNEHGVELKKFPDDVLRHLKTLSEEVVEKIAARDPVSRKVIDSQREFQGQVERWHDVSEFAYFNARRL